MSNVGPQHTKEAISPSGNGERSRTKTNDQHRDGATVEQRGLEADGNGFP